MAIDTQTKRRSVLGYTHPAIILPLVDGTIAALDRQHVCGIYAGIAAGSLVSVGVVSFTSEAVALATFADESLTLATFSSEAVTLTTFADEDLEN